MYRLIKMSGTWYATEIEYGIEKDVDNIQAFIENGEIVVLADDLEWAADQLGIDFDEIELVD